MTENINNILLIEDDPTIRSAISSRLTREISESIIVTSLDNAEDGLNHLNTKHYDIIITDLNLQKTDGFQLVEIMRLKGIVTPVVLISGFVDSEITSRVLKFQNVAVMQKPFQFKDLILQIKRMTNN